jgi:deoxyribonuclease-4
MSKVYYADMKTEDKDNNLINKLSNLFYKAGFDDLIEEVDNKIGLNNLKLIHLNDSKFEINTKKDRHEHIGQGKIGIENFEYIVNHKKLANKLFILETPPFDGEDKDIQTILKLKGE